MRPSNAPMAIGMQHGPDRALSSRPNTVPGRYSQGAGRPCLHSPETGIDSGNRQMRTARQAQARALCRRDRVNVQDTTLATRMGPSSPGLGPFSVSGHP